MGSKADVETQQLGVHTATEPLTQTSAPWEVGHACLLCMTLCIAHYSTFRVKWHDH